MAHYAYEIMSGRREETTDGSPRYFREFVAFSNDLETPQTEPVKTGAEARQLVFDMEGVTFGVAHPDEIALVAVDFNVRQSENESFLWHVIWEYRLLEVPAPQAAEKSISYFKQFIDAWRGEKVKVPVDNQNNPQFVPDPNFRLLPPIIDQFGQMIISRDPNVIAGTTIDTANENNGSDIRGFPIDSAGEPASIAIQNAQLNIGQFVQGTGIFSVIRDLIGKRNAFVFEGFNPGTLLYLGADSSRAFVVTPGPDILEVIHQFAYDEFFHLRQMVWNDPNSREPMRGIEWQDKHDPGGDGGLESIYIDHGFPVHWIQPFPFVADFTLLGIGLGP